MMMLMHRKMKEYNKEEKSVNIKYCAFVG